MAILPRVLVEVCPPGDTPAANTPLGYMLQVMNDQTVDEARRDRMAIAAAPFMHPRMADNRFGKRDDEKAGAAHAASGRYATPTVPLRVVQGG